MPFLFGIVINHYQFTWFFFYPVISQCIFFFSLVLEVLGATKLTKIWSTQKERRFVMRRRKRNVGVTEAGRSMGTRCTPLNLNKTFLVHQYDCNMSMMHVWVIKLLAYHVWGFCRYFIIDECANVGHDYFLAVNWLL